MGAILGLTVDTCSAQYFGDYGRISHTATLRRTRILKRSFSIRFEWTNTSSLVSRRKHNHHNHHHQAQTGWRPFVFHACCLFFMAEHSGQPSGAARRRRERRLRSMLRHEQQTVRMALAAALHHSAGPKEKVEMVHDAHDAQRGQKTPPPGVRPGSLSDPGPQRSDRTVRRSSGETPLLTAPMLADAVADAVDITTAKFLLRSAIRELEEERNLEETCVTTETEMCHTSRPHHHHHNHRCHFSQGDLVTRRVSPVLWSKRAVITPLAAREDGGSGAARRRRSPV